MFAHISGVVAEKNADSIVIDAGGIGFLLNVSAATLSAAPATGEKFKLYTIFNVREDAMELCGFATREEKRMYERLRSVGGVGSKLALSVLSSLSVHDLSVALVTGDAAALCRVPGIGKKLAQRLVLELKDKVEDSQLASSAAPISPKSAGIEAEAIAALVALGFSSAEAAKAVSAHAATATSLDNLIYLALKSAT
ncbi:MAG: Holliday junction branch migration protein RuvA [Candidatus Faecivicinus sp.]|nr:Holliday junction branch migration protein RuvA [Candidatus Faecivicinus sp.]